MISTADRATIEQSAETALLAAIEEAMSGPFVWGARDCCTSACDALIALGFPDAAASWRGRYADEAEAEAILAAGGGMAQVVGAAFAAQGWPPIAPEAARLGDLGLVMSALGPSLALFDGARWRFKSPRRGVRRARRAAYAWATGYA